ncbi:hypothetical protein [Streptomyces sp. NPDC007172]|uniref:hypothetical protein n=1 Tax=Streptomyces sp. NPDC007172 TaxID=3364776 RepID=UPI0036B55C8C
MTKENAHAALDLHAPQPDGARAYRAAFPQVGPEELVETVYSDACFRMPSQKLAEANATAGGTSYLFELRWVAPALGGILGACHSLDVPLAFGTLDSPAGIQLIGEDPLPRPSRSPANSRRHGFASSPPATRAGPPTGPTGT